MCCEICKKLEEHSCIDKEGHTVLEIQMNNMEITKKMAKELIKHIENSYFTCIKFCEHNHIFLASIEYFKLKNVNWGCTVENVYEFYNKGYYSLYPHFYLDQYNRYDNETKSFYYPLLITSLNSNNLLTFEELKNSAVIGSIFEISVGLIDNNLLKIKEMLAQKGYYLILVDQKKYINKVYLVKGYPNTKSVNVTTKTYAPSL